MPLLALSGSPAALVLLPFVGATLLGLWWFIRRNYGDAALRETLRLWKDLITVERMEPCGQTLRWHADPYWVKVRIHPGARIENYLTLKGNGREIELGAFLSPQERREIFQQINTAIGRLRAAP